MEGRNGAGGGGDQRNSTTQHNTLQLFGNHPGELVLNDPENELEDILYKLEGGVPSQEVFNLLYEWVSICISTILLGLGGLGA